MKITHIGGDRRILHKETHSELQQLKDGKWVTLLTEPLPPPRVEETLTPRKT